MTEAEHHDAATQSVKALLTKAQRLNEVRNVTRFVDAMLAHSGVIEDSAFFLAHLAPLDAPRDHVNRIKRIRSSLNRYFNDLIVEINRFDSTRYFTEGK